MATAEASSASGDNIQGPPSSGGDSPAAAPQASSADQETRGFLYKWTNYLKGYQKRWFVLANGLLHYYRNQAEMSRTCRGSISLHGAHIFTEDSCNFTVTNAGGTQTYHLRAASEVERQNWVTALELAKTRALQRISSSEDDVLKSEGSADLPLEIDKQELINVTKYLSSKLEDMRTCHGLIDKHRHALQHSLSELEPASPGYSEKDLSVRMKMVNERATLLNITCNAMINASQEFLVHCQTHGKRWHQILESEREIRQQLEDMVQQLARQHSHLETLVRREYEHTDQVDQRAKSPIQEHNNHDKQRSLCSSDDEEFEDANDEFSEQCFEVSVPPSHRRHSSELSGGVKSNESSFNDEESDRSDIESGQEEHNTISVIMRKHPHQEDHPEEETEHNPIQEKLKKPQKKRRTRIPDKPNVSFSLWSIMKNCIGKDLSKIPVPVNFSEPLSMLQRLSEDFEYSEILDKAASCHDDCEQLAYVAAFTVSSYSTTAIRTGKPFNPLLGETYELDRSDDKGFRCISEQVSHHPPMVAQYCESVVGSWRCWQEFTMRSKFKGKYLEVEPLGIAHLVFTGSGNHYTWRKVKTVVHNIVIGKLWIDQHGEMEVVNHRNGDKCHMKFEPYSYFGGMAKKVTGTITSSSDKVEWVLNGTWDTKLEGSRVVGEAKNIKGKSSLEIDDSRLLWKANLPYQGAEKFYNFSRFACELNEPEDSVSPTDSRLRPDQRMMEVGEWDQANLEKVRLEEKQRSVRRQREQEAELAAREGRTVEGHQPIWFKREMDSHNGDKMCHVYKGGYWESKAKQDWSKCPDIF